MPTVPVVDQTTGGSAPYGAPEVTPVRNFAPQQQIAMGQETQQLGEQMMTIGDRMQEQIDDARVKQAETGFLNAKQQILYDPQNGYLNQRGQFAMDAYGGAKQALDQAQKDAMGTLSDPVQKQMLRQVMLPHLLDAGEQMANHNFQQTSQYSGAAAADRARTYAISAINAGANYGKKDVDGNLTGDFASNVGTAEKEALNAVRILRGASAGSANADAALLDLHTQIGQGVVMQMMDARAFFSKVQSVFDDMKSKQWFTPDAMDSLGKMVRTYTEQESTRATSAQFLSDAQRDSAGQPTSSTGTPDYQFAIKGATITTQPYNEEDGGVTVNVAKGTSIQAPADGVVTEAGKDGDGNFSMKIQHPDGSVTTFSGLSAANVGVGDHVQRGEDVASSGQREGTSAPSVLWSLTDPDGNAVDPTKAGLPPVDLTKITSEPVLQGALTAMRKQVTDPYLQQQATSEMESIVRHNQAMANAASTQLYKQASDAFYNGGMQWRNIPPSIYNQLSPGQQQTFKDEQTHETRMAYQRSQLFKTMGATDIVSSFTAHPDILTPANVEAARSRLSNATYVSLMAKAQQFENNPADMKDAQSLNDRISFFAAPAGVNVEPRTPEDKQYLIGLTQKVQQDIDRVKAQNHGNVTQGQMDDAIRQELTQRAFANQSSAPPGSDAGESPAQQFTQPQEVQQGFDGSQQGPNPGGDFWNDEDAAGQEVDGEPDTAQQTTQQLGAAAPVKGNQPNHALTKQQPKSPQQVAVDKLVAAQDAERADPNNKPKGKDTFCNRATINTLQAMGVSTQPFSGYPGWGGRADQVALNFATSSAYREVSPEEAQAAANQGVVVVGAFRNPHGHGHLVTVRPEGVKGDAPAPGKGPLLSNVGKDIGVVRYSHVFRPSAEVHFYVPRG